jgi:phosphopantetheine adenylyltransferase
MRTFREYFEDMETRVERIALLPGGFKPPTKGHFNALRYLLEDADRGIVFIGGKAREGITPEQSEKIWNIYAKYFDKPVEVVYVPNPVKAVYDFADEHLDNTLLVGAGEKDEDVKRYKYFQDNVEKYPYVNVVKIPMQEEGISGSETREIIQRDISDALEYFVPEEISIEDRDQIKAILV